MPSKKKKYNARFPAGRIKKIMQTDEEVGKVAQAVPIIISRTLELFVESLLTKTVSITVSRNAKTLTPSHLKQCILSESRFDFLKDLVRSIPDASVQEDNDNNAEADLSDSNAQASSSSRPTPVIQFHPRIEEVNNDNNLQNNIAHIGIARVNNTITNERPSIQIDLTETDLSLPPPLIPISSNSFQSQSNSDSLFIDEDYDN